MVDPSARSPQSYPSSTNHSPNHHSPLQHKLSSNNLNNTNNNNNNNNNHPPSNSSAPSSSSATAPPSSSSSSLTQQQQHQQASASLASLSASSFLHHRHPSEIHGPLSAGVVENAGHRHFPSFFHPLQPAAPVLPFPGSRAFGSSPSSSSSVLAHRHSTAGDLGPPSSSRHAAVSSNNGPSYPATMTVADIIERFQDAKPEVLMSCLNAKAKEDERHAEEERHRTEKVKLQIKNVELDILRESRSRGLSPPDLPYGRTYANTSPGSNAHHASAGSGPGHGHSHAGHSHSHPHTSSHGQGSSAPASGSAYYSSSSSSAPQSGYNSNHHGPAYEHDRHTAVKSEHYSRSARDSVSSPSTAAGSNYHPHQRQEQQHAQQQHHSYQQHPQDQKLQTLYEGHPGNHAEQQYSQPSPSTRPPGLKINTSFQQAPYSAPPITGQRPPISPHPSSGAAVSNKQHQSAAGTPQHQRQYTLPELTASAHSSPVAVLDYQGHIPVTPSDDPMSPTAVSGSNKRKQTSHDAVMDAVRAKALRNVEQQQQQQLNNARDHHHHPYAKRASTDHDKDGSGASGRGRKSGQSNSNSSTATPRSAVPKSKGSPSDSSEEHMQMEGVISPADVKTEESTPMSARGGSKNRNSESPTTASPRSQAPSKALDSRRVSKVSSSAAAAPHPQSRA